MKKYLLSIIGISIFLCVVSSTSAHVAVKPLEVGVGAYQTFTVGVPNERDIPNLELRLSIPEGITNVIPNVKPGWTVTVKKSGEGEEAKVTEITWTGGNIPPGQRDEFVFSAKTTNSETTVLWKAYQLYEDGKIVSWDQAPITEMSDEQKKAMEKEGKGPYSQTKVVNDLSKNTSMATNKSEKENSANVLSALALALAVAALAMQLRKKS